MSTATTATLPVNAKKSKSVDKKPYATLIALGIGGFIVFIGTWFASQHLGQKFAQMHSEREAKLWADKAISLLEHQEQTFSNAALGEADKQALDQLLNASSMYRYVLFGPDGLVFWASKASKIGKVEGRAYFNDIVAKGHIFTKHAVKKAEEIDGFLKTRDGASIDPATPRQVTEIYVPIMKDGTFTGAMEVYLDVTNLLSWYGEISRKGSALLCGIVAIIFSIVGTMVWSYGRERTRYAAELVEAHDAALKSEAEANQLASEMKAINQEIVQLNRQLEANMKELSNAQDEIVRKGKMAQLGQLTATVAHELRNPLGAVRTSAYLIQRKFKDGNSGIEKPLERINTGIARCDRIITELLDFARSKELEMQETDFDSWLEGVVIEHAENLPEQVAIECRLDLNGAVVPFDQSRITRAVVNFMNNACEAMVGKGNQVPETPTPNPKIVVSTTLSARGVELSVADNGPGISQENRAKILEPLFTTKSFGVGLGLPAVEKIFEQHGGGMQITSQEGQGASFTGWFPLKQQRDVAA